MNRTALILSSVPLLAACASTPSEWNWTQPERVLATDPDTIRIGWRTWQVSEAVVRGHALLYCNGRPMQEVAADESTGHLSRAKTWQCLGP